MLNPLKVLLGFIFVFATACTNRETQVVPATNSSTAQDISIPQGIDVATASSEQCEAGGNIYSVYLDENKNGVKDSTEKILSTQLVCSGKNGKDGSTGKDGSNGSNGENGAPGTNGSNGVDGANGKDGINGINGHSLVYQIIDAPTAICSTGGSTIVMAIDVLDSGIYSPLLPNQNSLTVCNGSNGKDAVIPAYTPVSTILPCGNSVAYKEVLLRLENGQVLASFSEDTGGTMTRLAFLPDGTFMNTDSSGCTFSLATSSDGKSRSISWSGSIQMTWTMP